MDAKSSHTVTPNLEASLSFSSGCNPAQKSSVGLIMAFLSGSLKPVSVTGRSARIALLSRSRDQLQIAIAGVVNPLRFPADSSMPLVGKARCQPICERTSFVSHGARLA